MINKIYERIIKFIKTEYKFLIICACIILLFTIKLDYQIYTPGGLINIKNKITISDSYKSKGSINLTYVGAKDGIIPLILLSYIIPNWDLESNDESRIENENIKEVIERNKVIMKSVDQSAIIVAFKEANKEYKIKSQKYVVAYISSESETNLEIGDEVLEINGDKNYTEKEYFKDAKLNENLYMVVLRKGKEVNAYAKLKIIDSKEMFGISFASDYEIETNPKVTFKYKSNESGSSGGLMNALYIYNSITDYDITKGDVISGTGSIDFDGTIEPIDGVKYKLAGAVKKKADVFITPKKNYEEVIKEKKKHNYNIEIITGENFSEIVKKLKNR